MTGSALVIRSGGLGDFVLTLPLLAALRARGLYVRLLTRASYAALVSGSGLVHEAGDLEGAALYRPGRAPERLRRWVEGSLLIGFGPDRDGLLAGVARACGAREMRLLDPRPAAPPHVSLRMLRDAGLDPDPRVLAISLLARRGQGEQTLWLHPGSGSPAKNAPIDVFVACARAWAGPVVVSLGEAEHGEHERYRAAFGAPAELASGLTLTELRRRLEREAAAFIGNDSGPSHLAAALGIPTAAIFTRTDPEIWRPVGARVRVVRDAARLEPGELACPRTRARREPVASC